MEFIWAQTRKVTTGQETSHRRLRVYGPETGQMHTQLCHHLVLWRELKGGMMFFRRVETKRIGVEEWGFCLIPECEGEVGGGLLGFCHLFLLLHYGHIPENKRQRIWITEVSVRESTEGRNHHNRKEQREREQREVTAGRSPNRQTSAGSTSAPIWHPTNTHTHTSGQSNTQKISTVSEQSPALFQTTVYRRSALLLTNKIFSNVVQTKWKQEWASAVSHAHECTDDSECGSSTTSNHHMFSSFLICEELLVQRGVRPCV